MAHMKRTLVTVVETAEFARRARRSMTEADRDALVVYLASNPEAGVLLGGGVRKLRFARRGEGKSGGSRVIHFFHPGSGLPLFLITMFAKSEKANLTADETAMVVRAGETLAANYGKRE
jgi:hypothetical protein